MGNGVRPRLSGPNHGVASDSPICFNPLLTTVTTGTPREPSSTVFQVTVRDSKHDYSKSTNPTRVEIYSGKKWSIYILNMAGEKQDKTTSDTVKQNRKWFAHNRGQWNSTLNRHVFARWKHLWEPVSTSTLVPSTNWT